MLLLNWFLASRLFSLQIIKRTLHVGSKILCSPSPFSSFFLRYGYFSGINRKIQFKYLGKPRDGNESESSESRQSSESRDSGSDERSGRKKQGKDSKNKHAEANDEKEVKRKESKETKTQTGEEPKETEEVYRKGSEDKMAVPVDKDHSLLLIVKWGGELTTMGKEQALQLGRAFR